VNIAKHPQVSDLLTLERKEGRPQPLNRFVGRLEAEELTPMNAGKTHARKSLRILDNQVEYVAAVIGQSGVNEVDIRPKPLVTDLRLTQ